MATSTPIRITSTPPPAAPKGRTRKPSAKVLETQQALRTQTTATQLRQARTRATASQPHAEASSSTQQRIDDELPPFPTQRESISPVRGGGSAKLDEGTRIPPAPQKTPGQANIPHHERGATPSSYSSVQATNALQGTSISGGNNSFIFISQVPLGPDPDDGTRNVHWKVPRRTNTLFTGRRDVLGRIKNAIQDDLQQDGVFVITGLGGLGKSEICLKIANEMRSEFWAVFWVDVSSPDKAKSEFINVAGMLGQKVDSIEGTCRLLANTRKRCMLILDNADDPSFDYNAYLPSRMRGTMIMTSRYAECRRFNNIGWEALADLNTADCIELLLKAAEVPKERWGAETKGAEDVVRVVQSHTLALIQAGAYVARRHCKLADYHAEFQRQRARLLEFSSTQARSHYGNVYATFEASADVLSHDALDLLGVVSALSYSFLPVSLFESAWRGSQQARGRVADSGPGLGDLSSWDVSQPYRVIDLTGSETGLDVLDKSHMLQLPTFIGAKNNAWDAYLLNEALYLLQSLSLITRMEQDGASGLSMHPLVHAWARERQTEEARRANWLSAGCVITLAARGFPRREKIEQSVQTHVQSWVDERIEKSISWCGERDAMALVWSCSWMLIQMRDDRRLHNLLEVQFRNSGLDRTRLECSLVPLYHLWAQSYCLSGEPKLAVELMEYVVERRRETLDERHANRLAAEYLFAIANREIGKTQKAIELLDHAVKVQTTMLTETHPFRLASQHELAGTCLAI
ncbi:hypothetical protein DM02DRAFT_677987 [Periconia macrospinosa]|uniref:NB-ARC domain-containing protein n=1 Tax=Periconia macrospinosa TaxID=97972 RepID=A0A2V1D0R5_9PLEO|nr:hypothetical protein DM02DRAFT_677987 [Periconia macrospinosa]